MRLASAVWSSVSSTTISNCWHHTGLGLDTSSTAATANNLESATLRHESKALNAQVQQRPNLTHPAFQRVLTLLGGFAATGCEMSEEEIVARIEETHLENNFTVLGRILTTFFHFSCKFISY
jgi:hypothetical protein